MKRIQWRKWLRPNVLIPVLLVGGLIAALLSLTDIGKVLALIGSFKLLYLLYFFALMLVYEVIRGVQWLILLRALRVKTPRRTALFAFTVSEVTKALPIGNYVQNYLLQEARGNEDFGRTSAATTLIILLEVAVSLVGVFIVGDGSWTTWLRILIAVGVALVAGSIWLGIIYGRQHEAPQWITKHKRLQGALEHLKRFRDGVRDLLHARTLAVATALSALYLVVASVALYVVALGLGINVTFAETLAVYMLSLAISLILPLPVDIGVLELSMLGAFAALGVSRNAGLGASLLNRVLSIGSSLIIALVALIFLHDELMAALKSGRQHLKQPETPAHERQESKAHTRQKARLPRALPRVALVGATLLVCLLVVGVALISMNRIARLGGWGGWKRLLASIR